MRTETSLLAALRRTPSRVREGDLLPLTEQVVVVTGASSGIGLATVRRAAAAGAAVVLVARDAEALEAEVRSLRDAGGRAVHVVADVGDPEAVDHVARVAVETFGRVDTWVANAGVSMLGTVDDVPLADVRRLFDTTFFGVVHSSRTALGLFRGRTGPAAAFVAVGSVFGDRSTPLQTAYASAKHAVRAWVDGVRMEAEAEHVPVSVTLVHPGRIDTPYGEHAQHHVDHAAAHRDVVYPPSAVAEAILHAAQHPVRDLHVGSQAVLLAGLEVLAPRLTDRVMERYMLWGQTADRPPREPGDSALWSPGERWGERGDHPAWIRGASWWLRAEEHARAVRWAAAGTGAALLAAAALRRR